MFLRPERDLLRLDDACPPPQLFAKVHDESESEISDFDWICNVMEWEGERDYEDQADGSTAEEQPEGPTSTDTETIADEGNEVPEVRSLPLQK